VKLPHPFSNIVLGTPRSVEASHVSSSRRKPGSSCRTGGLTRHQGREPNPLLSPLHCILLILAAILVSPLSATAENTAPSLAPAHQAEVKSVTGKVEVAPPGSSSFTPIKAGQKIDIGSTIRSGSDGTAILITTPGAVARVGPDTLLVIRDLAFSSQGGKVTKRKTALDLKSGTVSALIDPGTPEITDFTVKTPQGIAAARGTFFGVTVEDGKAHVAVQEGKVGIQRFKKNDAAASSASKK
jgi:hypothetical protein